MGKLSEVNKSRILLYALMIGGIALVSLLVNAWNLVYTQKSGAVPVPTRQIEECADAETPMDLATLAATGRERKLFSARNIQEALMQGKIVIARTTPQDGPADYVRITGAQRDMGFLVRDGTGSGVTQPVRFYRIYEVTP